MIGQSRKRQPDDDKLPPADQNAYDNYLATRQAEYDRILQLHAKMQVDRENSWFRDYDGYLNSDEWKTKRRLVFKRSGGQCEGCGLAAATQVHHLTYRHAKQEFLFELVAVCEPCHRRLHVDDDDDVAEIRAGPGEEWEEHPCNGCRFTHEEGGKPYCFILNEPIAVALATDGTCGPNRALFEGLK